MAEPDWYNAWNDCEESTRLAIIELQLRDLKDIKLANETDDSDESVAIKIYERELRNAALYSTEIPVENREVACTQLFNCREEQAHGEHAIAHTETNEESDTKLEPCQSPMFECTACGDHKILEAVWQVPCGHHYCDDCLNELYQNATIDEQLFPPRCCLQPFNFEDMRHVLTEQVATDFEAKREELETQDRVYCHDPHCSAFISPTLYGDSGNATCRRIECRKETCTKCKKAGHRGGCPDDPDHQAALETMRGLGYQRCYHCHNMVELKVGCNHMICRCRAHFCYLCGRPWKQCVCPLWHEANLLKRAHVMANRDAAVRNQRVNAGHVRVAAVHLRNNHECVHVAWERLRGRHTCGSCNHDFHLFIFMCIHCRDLRCANCRFNRG